MLCRISPALFQTFLLVACACGCSQASVATRADTSDAASVDVVEDHSPPTADVILGGFEIGPPVDAPAFEAPPPPVVACHGDAGSDGGAMDAMDAMDATLSDGGGEAGATDPECALPPSVCGDSRTLVYYEGGACIGSVCSFTAKTQTCQAGCVHGACAPGPTL